MSEASANEGNQPPDGEPIEGGYIRPFDDVPFHEARHRAETARRLAFLLVWVLAVSVGLHYAATATLEIWGKATAVESLAKIFNMWLPVISALASAAGTYYFTRERS
jgi:hypothetical protein